MSARRFVVVGLGNFGQGAAEELYRLGHDVLAIDVREHVVDRIASKVTRAAVGDATDVEVLRALGATGADAAIVSTGDDITASVLSTIVLRDCGIHEIYVKVISHNHGRVMERLDVRETIFPERESAERLAKRVAARSLVNYVELAPGFSVQEMAVPESWRGRSLRELELPRRHRVTVVAVHDFLTDSVTGIPDPDTPLKDSDGLLVAGATDTLSRVAKLE
ncbi:MAG TPA: TrkA family potassium uptake protein [Thermoanaerobaculia bacterium]|nr:TrkA family potassium uptake protein [Thermoanaerobaculia bacterium]